MKRLALILLVLLPVSVLAQPIPPRGTVTVNLPVIDDRIVVYYGVSGRLIEDSGVSVADIVLASTGGVVSVWVLAHSNAVEYMESWTNSYEGWSNSTIWVVGNSNAVASVFGWTNQFEGFSNAASWVGSSSGGVAFVFGWTNQFENFSNAWDWVVANSNAVWQSDGTNVWRLSGRVGIGTNLPAYKLHVAGDIGCATIHVGVASAAISDSGIDTTADDFDIDSTLYITNGNVGIGTDNPTVALHVVGQIGTTNIVLSGIVVTGVTASVADDNVSLLTTSALETERDNATRTAAEEYTDSKLVDAIEFFLKADYTLTTNRADLAATNTFVSVAGATNNQHIFFKSGSNITDVLLVGEYSAHFHASMDEDNGTAWQFEPYYSNSADGMVEFSIGDTTAIPKKDRFLQFDQHAYSTNSALTNMPPDTEYYIALIVLDPNVKTPDVSIGMEGQYQSVMRFPESVGAGGGGAQWSTFPALVDVNAAQKMITNNAPGVLSTDLPTMGQMAGSNALASILGNDSNAGGEGVTNAATLGFAEGAFQIVDATQLVFVSSAYATNVIDSDITSP